VEIFSGLVFGGSGDDGDAAAALYRALLADGLAGLGPGIRRLVVVPDDVLHLLPFSALRPDPEAAPLASRYEITLTPSATLWLGWRQEDKTVTTRASALVLANPAPAPVVAPAALRAAAFDDLPFPRSLPGAEIEGEAVLRHLGKGSRLLTGPDATEAYLKRGPAPYGILHFATHAWTSDNEPDRSFVLLAPGSANEDGKLHPKEIAGLDLRGRIVVLSTCSSAAGEILRGEGVMGLAQAFFKAGAHTVVATLWPLRDDEGAALFDRFYGHLGDGMSVSAALRDAQQDRMDDGAPPAAWAGVIVLGDGARVPVPGGRRRLPGFAVPLALAASGLAALLALARRRVRK
jgi:CHAT domain-containing protein